MLMSRQLFSRNGRMVLAAVIDLQLLYLTSSNLALATTNFSHCLIEQ